MDFARQKDEIQHRWSYQLAIDGTESNNAQAVFHPQPGNKTSLEQTRERSGISHKLNEKRKRRETISGIL
jgi:hypothetical protein